MINLPSFLFSAADPRVGVDCGSAKIFGTSLYDGLCDPVAPHAVTIQKLSDIYTLIGNVIKILLSFVGMLSVIFIVVGGFMYVLSTGDPSRIQRAKSIVQNAIIGLIISLVSFAAVTFIAEALK